MREREAKLHPTRDCSIQLFLMSETVITLRTRLKIILHRPLSQYFSDPKRNSPIHLKFSPVVLFFNLHFFDRTVYTDIADHEVLQIFFTKRPNKITATFMNLFVCFSCCIGL